MLTVLILAENPALAVSLRASIEAHHDFPEQRISLHIVGKAPEGSRTLYEFSCLHETIAGLVAAEWAEGNSPLCVITDLQGYGTFQPERLDPLASDGWRSVLGMLILAFPEVHWIFSGCSYDGDDYVMRDACILGRDASFSEMLGPNVDEAFCPLFDPVGLRNRIRQVCGEQKSHGLPLRNVEEAAAIDDEREYALFHGYVAYRFGFRCHVVTTSKMLDNVFGADSTSPITLVFEDLFLNFPDQHIHGMSNLHVRDKKYKNLGASPRRVIVTTGYQQQREGALADTNLIHLEGLRAEGRWNVVVHKPVTGVYSLWEVAGISAQVGTEDNRGYALGFRRFSDPRATAIGLAPGHSTPGRLLEIAKRLLDRAAREPVNPRSACSAVHRAVLATDALELLGGRTPTTSLGALAQCHELEALAECQFMGVQGNFDVGLRLADLRREIKTLAVWYNPADREFSEWNAEAAILQRLIEVFKDHNQFSEEQFVRIRERELHRRIWFRRHFGEFGGSLRWLNPAYVVAWYVDFLLRSMPLFLIAIASWIAALTVLYALRFSPANWPEGLHYAVVSFFSMQPPSDTLRGGVVLLAILAGVLHVGVLISHLYAVVSRR